MLALNRAVAKIGEKNSTDSLNSCLSTNTSIFECAGSFDSSLHFHWHCFTLLSSLSLPSIVTLRVVFSACFYLIGAAFVCLCKYNHNTPQCVNIHSKASKICVELVLASNMFDTMLAMKWRSVFSCWFYHSNNNNNNHITKLILLSILSARSWLQC